MPSNSPLANAPPFHRSALSSLRRRWWLTAALTYGLWLALYLWFRGSWPEGATRWAALSALALAYVLWLLWRGLPAHHRSDEAALLPTFGPGTVLTLYRGLAISLLAGFLFSPWPDGGLAWLPALLYMTGDIADYLDGYAARVTNHATRLGEMLDMEIDSLGVLVVTFLAVWYGQLPWWYPTLGLARYLFVFGIWWRQRRGLPVHETNPSVHRRIIAGFHMGFLSAVLWPIVPATGAAIAGTLFAAATALSFWRDWLVVTGKLDPGSDRYRRRQRWLFHFVTDPLPLLLRLAFAAAMLAMVFKWPGYAWLDAWTDVAAAWRFPWPAALAYLVSGVLLLAAPAVLLGLMGRVAAFLMVFPLDFAVNADGLTWANGLALACVVCIMLFGSGRWSLWQPEERYLVRRAGEKEPV